MPSIITIYGADIKIKYSQVIQSSLTECYYFDKEYLVECILKKNARSCVTPTGNLFCCNDVYISCIVQHSTSELFNGNHVMLNMFVLQLFRQRLSRESVKAFATMPIGIMGRKTLALID